MCPVSKYDYVSNYDVNVSVCVSYKGYGDPGGYDGSFQTFHKPPSFGNSPPGYKKVGGAWAVHFHDRVSAVSCLSHSEIVMKKCIGKKQYNQSSEFDSESEDGRMTLCFKKQWKKSTAKKPLMFAWN